MPTYVWLPQQIRSVLLGIYASKTAAPGPTPAEASAQAESDAAYLDGCRAGVESLLLAFGLPMPTAGHSPPEQTFSPLGEPWPLEDIANVLAAIALCASSGPSGRRRNGYAGRFRQGVLDVVRAVGTALGAPSPGHGDARRGRPQASVAS